MSDRTTDNVSTNQNPGRRAKWLLVRSAIKLAAILFGVGQEEAGQIGGALADALFLASPDGDHYYAGAKYRDGYDWSKEACLKE